jgi:CRP-like cAMP-binding protein
VIYYSASKYLEKKGAAVRFPTRFREYALARKQEESRALIELLSKCDLLRHLPPEGIEQILPAVHTRRLPAGEVLFRAGDRGDALFIVAKGKVEVNSDSGSAIAKLGEGQAFGEMALLSGGLRTATVRAPIEAELLEIDRENFGQMTAADHQLATAVERLSHDRALKNLSQGGPNSSTWARIASSNLHNISRAEATKMLTHASQEAGMAIILGNILDTIPGCLVIGAKFHGLASLSLTLMLGMFLGGIPEAASSAAILTRAGSVPRRFSVFGLLFF